MTDRADATALFDRRLVLVAGKGGVGRSTCALALAVAALERHKRVLLLEVGQRAASSEILGAAPANHQPSQPNRERLPGLWIARLDPKSCLEEYLVEQLGLGRLVRLALDNRVLSRLWAAMPSVNEMALLNAVFKHEAKRDDGAYDLVILDMPATGHALAMLSVPRGLLAIVSVGPVARRAREIDELLHDPRRTAVTIVTLPEELPVNESVELIHRLKSIGLEATTVIVNAVMPEPFDAAERALLTRLEAATPAAAGRAVLAVAERLERRRFLQRRHIDDLRKAVSAELVEVAETARRGLDLIGGIASALAGKPGTQGARDKAALAPG